ncbi:DUF6279 family lipoprotein [Vibrio renipiscarius]|uniref:DUF6279 family lipoprotein n=1 Tax=Vibrio renipiscarius TaxID=1461322 RepID=UPI00069B09DE|nr:DUF6279 family lipoprotein [Vibrio renipiscarius]
MVRYIVRTTIFAVLSLGLLGCGSQFLYSNLDWLAIRYIEEFVDLNDDQQEKISAAFDQASDWHRREEMPLYLSELDQLLMIDPHAFDASQWGQYQNAIQGYSTRLLDVFFPVVISVATTMSDQQVEQFMNALRVRHVAFKNQIKNRTNQEFVEQYQQRIGENVTTWLGSISPEQQALVDAWANDLKVTGPLWSEFQTQLRVELLQALSVRDDPNALATSLRPILYEPQQFYSAELRKTIDYNSHVGRSYAIEIINLMTEKQTHYFRDEVAYWRDVIADLSL